MLQAWTNEALIKHTSVSSFDEIAIEISLFPIIVLIENTDFVNRVNS